MMNLQSDIEIESIYPLTPLQIGMAFHTLSAPNSGAYILQDSIKYKGELNQEAFWTAWEKLIERHSILRSFFARLDTNNPLQIVIKSLPLKHHYQDWRGLGEEVQFCKLRELEYDSWKNGVDVNKPPLQKITLVQLEDDLYRIIWTQHHAVTDGWSGAIIWNEWLQLYKAELEFTSVELPKPIEFKNYVDWLASQSKESARQYWADHLEGVKDSSQHVKTRFYSDNESNENKRIIGEYLSQSLTDKLTSFARDKEITLNNLIQGAWAYLLHIYSGSNDVVFGVTVSGRQIEINDVGRMVGPLINTVPVRARIDVNKKVSDWLADTYHEHTQRTKADYMSLMDIKECAQIASREEFFDSLIVFDNYPKEAGEVDTLGFEFVKEESYSYNHYPLTLMVVPVDKLYLSIKYDASKFSADQVERIFANFKKILLALLEVEFLQEISVSQEVDEKASSAGTLFECKSELFIKKFLNNVEKYPQRNALRLDKSTITYAQLNDDVDHLVAYLIQNRVEQTGVVGISVLDPQFMVTGMLAAHKLGIAFTIIDSAWSERRLSDVMEELPLNAMLVEQETLDLIPEIDCLYVSMDRDWQDIRAADVGRVSVDVDELSDSKTAYYLYTSGSTGRPKGVVVSQKSLAQYIAGIQEHTHIEGENAWLALASASADLGYTSIFGALASAGTLRLFRQADYLNADYLSEAFANHPVDIMKIVPSHLQALLYSRDSVHILPKKILIMGGDVLPTELVEKIREISPTLRIINHYGPTEATIGAAVYEIDNNLKGYRQIPIGKALKGRKIYLLDENLKPVPMGIVGKLYIGGAGLADGYFNNPQLSDEKFVQNPWGHGGEKMYDTGDLAYWGDGGNILFVGRKDNQIKRRGHRVELGEIQSLIAEHPQVDKVVVLSRKDMLFAFVVANDITQGVLKEYAASQMHEIFIPDEIVFVDEIALTSNGKIDGNVLFEHFDKKEKPEKTLMKPANETETRILGFWQTVLKRQDISVNDSFFDVGGNSLLLIQLHGAIKKHFDTKLKIVDLFKYVTVQQQAAYFDGGTKSFDLSGIEKKYQSNDSTPPEQQAEEVI